MYVFIKLHITTQSGPVILVILCHSHCMYVCMVMTYSRVWINRLRLPILLVVSWTGKMNIPLSPYAPENLVSQYGFSSPVPRRLSHLHTQAESGAYLRDSPRVPRRRPFIYFKPPYAIGSVPSLSSHAIAYRWRLLPRVRRDRARKPQGSYERVLPWQVTMDQVICASLSHTHYWYEVGMLKVPACVAWNNINCFSCCCCCCTPTFDAIVLICLGLCSLASSTILLVGLCITGESLPASIMKV